MFSLVPYISFALAQQNLKIWGSGCAFAPGRDLALAGEEKLTAGADQLRTRKAGKRWSFSWAEKKL